ncbi:MAG: hypothetical protein ACR2HN_00055 [Tepidiformaceae bacterium]
MSQLHKAIGRTQRREGPRLGFGPTSREQPRAMLAIVMAGNAKDASAAFEAGADAVILGGSAAAVATAVKSVAPKGACVGALVPSLDVAGAEALHKAGCDFAVSTLDGTAAAALDTEQMGHVLSIEGTIEDNVLRALGPLGLDALYVAGSAPSMTVAGQVELVRLASFSGTPLLVGVEPGIGASDLRVLRDSGAVGAIAPQGTTAGQVKALVEALKAVPPPKRSRREGSDIALVPAVGRPAEEEDHEHEDDD